MANEADGLHVLDLNTPASPVEVPGFGTSGGASSLSVSANLACVANQERGLQVLRLREGIPQTLAFAPTALAPLSQSPITLTGAASSEFPVSFSVVSGPATIIGNQLFLAGLGSVILRAEQAGTEELALSNWSVTEMDLGNFSRIGSSHAMSTEDAWQTSRFSWSNRRFMRL